MTTAVDGWGREFLERCGLDPANEAAVRAAYESCREQYAGWLVDREGEIDAEAYYMLVDALYDAYGWQSWPWEWPPPHVVVLSEPLKNALPRDNAHVWASARASQDE